MTPEEQLSRTLHERAGDLEVLASGRPLTLDDVRGQARRVRRRQAALVTAGVALVAAVVLPIAVLAGTTDDRSEPSPAPSPTRAVDPFRDGVPTLQDGVIIHPDGGPRIPLVLERGEVADGFAPLGADRWVVTVQTGAGERAVLLTDSTGHRLATYAVSGGLAAQRGEAVAWLDPAGTPRLLVAGSDEPQDLSGIAGADPSAVALTGDCARECAVWVHADGGGELGRSYRVSTDGTVTDAPLPDVVDVSPDEDLIAGLDRVADDDVHQCGGLYDVRAGDYRWPSCEPNVYLFSPDAGLVATQFGEGLGPREVSLRDAANGTVVAELSDARVASIAWEDDEHLLAVVVAEDGSTRLERIGTDGRETLLDGFMTTDDVTLPLILPVTG